MCWRGLKPFKNDCCKFWQRNEGEFHVTRSATLCCTGMCEWREAHGRAGAAPCGEGDLLLLLGEKVRMRGSVRNARGTRRVLTNR
jgi:hypothetical protein